MKTLIISFGAAIILLFTFPGCTNGQDKKNCEDDPVCSFMVDYMVSYNKLLKNKASSNKFQKSKDAFVEKFLVNQGVITDNKIIIANLGSHISNHDSLLINSDSLLLTKYTDLLKKYLSTELIFDIDFPGKAINTYYHDSSSNLHYIESYLIPTTIASRTDEGIVYISNDSSYYNFLIEETDNHIVSILLHSISKKNYEKFANVIPENIIVDNSIDSLFKIDIDSVRFLSIQKKYSYVLPLLKLANNKEYDMKTKYQAIAILENMFTKNAYFQVSDTILNTTNDYSIPLYFQRLTILPGVDLSIQKFTFVDYTNPQKGDTSYYTDQVTYHNIVNIDSFKNDSTTTKTIAQEVKTDSLYVGTTQIYKMSISETPVKAFKNPNK